MVLRSIRRRTSSSTLSLLFFIAFTWPGKAFWGTSHGQKSTQDSLDNRWWSHAKLSAATHVSIPFRLLRRNASGHPRCGSFLYFFPMKGSLPARPRERIGRKLLEQETHFTVHATHAVEPLRTTIIADLLVARFPIEHCLFYVFFCFAVLPGYSYTNKQFAMDYGTPLWWPSRETTLLSR